MAAHFRMIDNLSEAHLMAVTQGKHDIAKLLLRAIEIEQDKYTQLTADEKRRLSMNMLAVAKERQATIEKRLRSTD